MKKLFIAAVAVGTMMAVPSAFAAGSLVKACKGDLKKFGCKVKTDEAAHECLEKNEQKDKPNEGYSKGCYAAHEAFEKKSGKEEKGEEHKE